MPYSDYGKHYQKSGLYEEIFRGFNKPISCYVTLPGIECRDVIAGMEMGVINTNTVILAFESESERLDPIRRKLQELGFSVLYVEGSTDREKAVSAIHNVHKSHNIELMNLDWCNNISQEKFDFLSGIKSVIRSCVVSVTFSCSYRPSGAHPTINDTWWAPRTRRKAIHEKARIFNMTIDGAYKYGDRLNYQWSRFAEAVDSRRTPSFAAIYLDHVTPMCMFVHNRHVL